MKRLADRLAIGLLAMGLAACDTSAAIKATTADGEIFSGSFVATGAWDTSGTLQLVSNRGLTCLGRFVFEGIAGPKGTTTFDCNNGEHGQADLEGVPSGYGRGTIGTRPITFSYGKNAT